MYCTTALHNLIILCVMCSFTLCLSVFVCVSIIYVLCPFVYVCDLLCLSPSESACNIVGASLTLSRFESICLRVCLYLCLPISKSAFVCVSLSLSLHIGIFNHVHVRAHTNVA